MRKHHNTNAGMQETKYASGHMMHTAMFKTRFFVCLALTILVLILSTAVQNALNYTLNLPYQAYLLLFLSVIIYGYGGWPFLKGLTEELRQLQPGMMTLIATAISVAFFFSAAAVFFPVGTDFFWELATLIDVMLLGHWIEARSVMGASRALEELVKIIPTTAHVVKDDKITDVSVSSLTAGDFVLVRPGEKIPSDAIITDGESYVNEALLTGESQPVHKTKNDKVIGGALNGEGAFKAKIEKTGEETYLAQVIKLVGQAQQSRSRTQDLANRAAALLFYVALSVGVVTYGVWAVFGNPQFALTRTVTVLVIACPHALGLAIPLVIALSTSITAKSGILIRDRKAFETAKDVDAVVFDKTGTLTTGQFGVNDVVAYLSEAELVRLAAAVEKNSEHIIAKAIVNYATKTDANLPETVAFQAIPGKGAKGTVEGKTVYVGSAGLLQELKITLADDQIAGLQDSGKTVVFTVVDGKLAGAFALADQVRPESVKAVKELKANGIKVYMLTGDSEAVARGVSRELGIEDYFAQVLPDQKATQITALKEKGCRVMMVGDGINDAPALVTADVGVAIGAGTDVAVESADIILVKNDPRDIVKVVDLSKKTYSKMVQNLWWAAGYNIFAIPLAAGVLAGFGVVVDPAVGAILMSLSTVLVAVNSQTLRRYEPKTDLPKGSVQSQNVMRHMHEM